MFSITLDRNQSNPRRFVATLTYERYGDKVVPVRRVWDGPNHCVSSTEMPWPRKDWAPAFSGEKGKHGRPFAIKRDWIQLHTSLAMERAA